MADNRTRDLEDEAERRGDAQEASMPRYGCYRCRVCGELHASDDTELWCAINAQIKKDKEKK